MLRYTHVEVGVGDPLSALLCVSVFILPPRKSPRLKPVPVWSFHFFLQKGVFFLIREASTTCRRAGISVRHGLVFLLLRPHGLRYSAKNGLDEVDKMNETGCWSIQAGAPAVINAAARVNDLSAESHPWKLDVMVKKKKKSDVSLKESRSCLHEEMGADTNQITWRRNLLFNPMFWNWDDVAGWLSQFVLIISDSCRRKQMEPLCILV